MHTVSNERDARRPSRRRRTGPGPLARGAGARAPAALIPLSGLLAGAACASGPLILDRGPQAYYQTAFPTHDTSRELEQAFRSIKRVTYTTEYTTYFFGPDAGVTDTDSLTPAVLGRAVQRLTDTQSKSGTAVILGRSPRSVVLLTNHHVVHAPAVRIQYFDEEEGARRRRTPRRIASVSVRRIDVGILSDHTGLGPFEVVARDSANDLALIELRMPEGTDATRFPPIPIAAGDPGRLSWGSFVYVLGYPRGYAMVTRGIVSDPNRDRRGGFLTDGLWNEGISGGAILAVRGETGRLEWVGVARAGAGSREVLLQPRGDEVMDEEGPRLLYRGPIYLDTVLRIQHGITLSVPMTQVRAFVNQHGSRLRARGFDVRGF